MILVDGGGSMSMIKKLVINWQISQVNKDQPSVLFDEWCEFFIHLYFR